MRCRALLEIEGPIAPLIKKSMEPDLSDNMSLELKNRTLVVRIRADRVSKLRAMVNSVLRTVQVLSDIHDEMKELQ